MSGIDTRSKTTGQKPIQPILYEGYENVTFAHSKMGNKYGFETGVTTVTHLSGANDVWSGKTEDGLLYSYTEFDSKENSEYVIEKAVKRYRIYEICELAYRRFRKQYIHKIGAVTNGYFLILIVTAPVVLIKLQLNYKFIKFVIFSLIHAYNVIY